MPTAVADPAQPGDEYVFTRDPDTVRRLNADVQRWLLAHVDEDARGDLGALWEWSLRQPNGAFSPALTVRIMVRTADGTMWSRHQFRQIVQLPLDIWGSGWVRIGLGGRIAGEVTDEN